MMAAPNSTASDSTTHSDQVPMSTDKNFKRKFEDAIYNLDEAVGPLEPLIANPPPAKKLRTGRSLYSTLAKYGIKTEVKPTHHTSPDKLESLSKAAPHLAAIIARTTSRARKALPFKFGHQPTSSTSISSAPSRSSLGGPSESDYRPSSTTSFLTRLATFKLTTYANKPPAIDAVSASKCGWVNDGKDRLVCGICHVSWVVAGKGGMSRDAANALIEKQRQSLVDMHKDGCPWKMRQCDPSIYRVPLYAPVAMARELKSRAAKLAPILHNVEIRHPLTASQVQSLMLGIKTIKNPSFSFSFDEPPISAGGDTVMGDETHANEAQPESSESAVLTALFGWDILPPALPSERLSRMPSISRANSVAPSVPKTPVRLVRAASGLGTRESTPSPSPSRHRPSLSQGAETSPVSSTIASANKPDLTQLHCVLCQRRVGLWAFISSPQPEGAPTPAPTQATPGKASKPQPRRPLDILKEHRSYCPYVVRSTEIPSLPIHIPQQVSRSNSTIFHTSSNPSLNGQPGAVEGWRAVLTIVLRYGAAQRQRIGLDRIPSERRAETPLGSTAESSEEASHEVDEVEAMVAGVKSHGGRELLKYVKNLLG